MDFMVDGNNLVDAQKKTIIKLQQPIDKFFTEENKIYVLLRGYVSRGNYIRGNVWCFDLSGNRLWESEEIKSPTAFDSYSNAYIKNQKLFAVSGSGYRVELDKNTGKILYKEFLK
jgi:outer membrane protein assembly factor BamB